MAKTQRDRSEKCLITAEDLIAPKRDKILGNFKPRKAILVFMNIGDMEKRFNEKGGQPIAISPYLKYWIRDDGALLCGPIIGGPICASILEELAVYGVRDVIGYGLSGALDPSIPPTSIMVADSALCSDGTSKEYTDEKEAYPDPAMMSHLLSVIEKHGIKPETGKVWTMDAIYRELPSKVAYWKKKGARFVNMETGNLYAVAKQIGLRAAYISVVSDTLDGNKWSGWYDCKTAVEKMWNICLEAVETI